MTFKSDIAKFSKKTLASADQIVRAIKISLFSGVILDTRVDTGRLRGNWQTSNERPNYEPTDREDKTGSLATDEVIKTVKGGSVDYLTNNLPYAEVWEERDSMVSKNMARIQRNVSDAVNGVKR